MTANEFQEHCQIVKEGLLEESAADWSKIPGLNEMPIAIKSVL